MKPYPLEAAAALRARQLEGARAALASALAAERESQRVLEVAQAVLDDHVGQTREFRERPVPAVSAAELQRDCSFLARRRAERAVLHERVSAAAAARDLRAAEAEAARRAVVHAEAEHKAIREHRERWEKGERSAAERSTEQEAEDVLQARRR